MAGGRFLSIRLFLEGVEVDVISAITECGVGRPATATIAIPAVSHSLSLLPRTLVHLFYYQNSGSSTAGQVQRTEGSTPPSRLIAERYRANSPKDMGSWTLLFSGEVLAFGYNNVGGLRQTTLSCQDFSSYWTAAKIYWGTTKRTGLSSHKKAIFAGASLVNKPGAVSKSTIANILKRSPVTIPGLHGLMGGIVALLEQCTGVYDGKVDSKKNFRGVNDFMSQAEARLHLTRMLGIVSDDDSSAMLIRSKSFERYFKKLTASVKATASFEQLISLLLGKIHHRYASVLAPAYFRQGETVKVTTKVKTGSIPGGAPPALTGIYAAVRKAYIFLSEGIDFRNRDFRKNRWPMDDTWHSKGKRGHPVETDTVFLAKFAKDIEDTGVLTYTARAIEALSSAVNGAAVGATAVRRASNLSSALHDITEGIRELRPMVEQPVSGTWPHSTIRTAVSVRAQFEKALGKMKGGGRGIYKDDVRDATLGDRLNMFLFHPDIYMCAPPNCNVIFPDHYSSIRYTRSWLSEITRLWMFGRKKNGQDKKDIYFSPNVSLIGIPDMKDAVTAVRKGASFTMKHERYTGIIPSFQGLGDNDAFKTVHKAQIRDAKAKGDSDGSSVSGRARNTPQEHLQRSANFMFFAARYRSRTATLSARFLPNLVPGLPALVLDPDLVEYASRNSGDLSAAGTGSHFLGTPYLIRHTITAQGGASTAVQFGSCRTHNEGTDLFGDQTPGVVQRVTKLTTTHVVAPGAGKQHTVAFNRRKDVFHKPAGDFANIESRTPGDVNGLTVAPGATYMLRPRPKDGLTSTSADPFTDNADFDQAAVEGDGLLVVDVLKTTTKTKKVDVEFAMEDTLMPPWFSRVYRKARIGPEYYQFVVGCGSILDGGLSLNADDQETVANNIEAALAAAAFLGLENEQVTVLYPIRAANGDLISEVAIPTDMFDPDAATVETAAESLARLWIGLKNSGADVDLFIDNYTDRRYANMEDVLGTNNKYLRFNQDMNATDDVVGFHGNAYGDFSNMEDITDAPLTPETRQGGEKTGETRSVSGNIDPRGGRRARVIKYSQELKRRTAHSRLGR